MGCLVQADARYFFSQDPALTNNEAFLLRRARIFFEGTLNKDTGFLITPDFAANSTTTLQIVDAYLNYAVTPAFQFRAGRFREPVGLEALQSDATAFFVERSLVSSLLPKRDIGFQLGGDLLNGTLSYALGVFDGVADGSDNNLNTETDNDKDAAARLFYQPFKNDVASPLRGLGFGLGASYGREKPVAANLTGGYKTDGQQTFFSYRAQSAAAASKTNFSTVADGHTWRVSPQAYYYRGPFGLLGEYALSVVNVRPNFPATFAGSPKVELKNTAWQLAAGYVLTGEDAAYAGVVPKTNFSWADGTWGAFEIVARYAMLDIDDAAFVSPGAGYSALADPNNNASKVGSLGLGLNWYLSKTIRASLDYFHSSFGLTTGAVPTTRVLLNHDENALITRLQVAF
jgi:phosphate-selective porin OprO/OprP